MSNASLESRSSIPARTALCALLAVCIGAPLASQAVGEVIPKARFTEAWKRDGKDLDHIQMYREDDGSFRVEVGEASASPTDAVLIFGNVQLVVGGRYTLTFSARSDEERSYTVRAMLQNYPYGPVSPDFTAVVGTSYEDFEFSFVAGSACAGNKVMLPYFPLGRIPGMFWIKDVSLVGPIKAPASTATKPLPKGFFPYKVQWDDGLAGTASDMSFLNAAPAGTNGRIVARDGHLYEEMTGERVRFFGINLGYMYSFPMKEDAEIIARRLAKAGINLVRFAMPNFDEVGYPPDFSGTNNWNDTVFQDPASGHAELNRDNLDRFDYLVYRLKERGIYVYLTLKWGETLNEADGLPPEALKDNPFSYQCRADVFDETLRGYQIEHARSFLSRVNPYTGASYAQDECVAIVACFNENSLLDYWQDSLGTKLDTLPAYFRDELRGLWNEWLRAKYGSDTALRSAWFGKSSSFASGLRDLALRQGETLAAGTIPILAGTERQRPDWIDFLAETERGWIDRMRSLVKDELGCRALFIGSQVEYGGTTGYGREELSDLADSHMYWDLPSMKGGGQPTLREWYIQKNSSQIQALSPRDFETLGWLAMHRQADRPFSVSESDYSAVNDFHSESVPLLASFAAYQDWDIICGFEMEACTSYYAPDKITSLWDQSDQPSVWSFYPLAAYLFRQALIPPAKSQARIELAPSPWKRFEYVERAWDKLLPGSSMGFLSRAFCVAPSTEGRAFPEDALASNQKDSVTPLALKELSMGKAYVAESETVALAAGYLGGATVKTKYADFTTGRFGNGHASLILASLDGEPLPASARLLLCVAGRSQNQGIEWDSGRTTFGEDWGYGPTITERVPLKVSIARSASAKVWALDARGVRVKEVKAEFRDGRLVFSPMAEADSLLFEIAE